MSTAERIYRAIEMFSGDGSHYGIFKTAFGKALLDHGVPDANARQMAQAAAESLRGQEDLDYHLGMAQTIAFGGEFERAMGKSPEAFQAMHLYMSYYLDHAETQQTRVAS